MPHTDQSAAFRTVHFCTMCGRWQIDFLLTDLLTYLPPDHNIRSREGLRVWLDEFEDRLVFDHLLDCFGVPRDTLDLE